MNFFFLTVVAIYASVLAAQFLAYTLYKKSKKTSCTEPELESNGHSATVCCQIS